MQLVPYLNFNGQCEAAFKFYQELFGGKIAAMLPVESTPAAAHVPEGSGKDIMHARLEADGFVLMGSDTCGMPYLAPQGLHLSLHPETIAEAERLYNALTDGGQATMPLEQTFWAVRFAMVTDRFGVPWMINCEKEA